MSNASDFIIENGVLTKYVGPGGDVVIPEGVTKIDGSAFWSMGNLTGIVIPETVVSIGNCAFESCWRLTALSLPASVREIGQYTFRRCGHLQQVICRAESLVVGTGTFSECEELKELSAPPAAFEALWKVLPNEKKESLALQYLASGTLPAPVQAYIKRKETAFLQAACAQDNVAMLERVLSLKKKHTLGMFEEYLAAAEGHTEATAYLIDFRNRLFTVEDVTHRADDLIEKDLGFKERTLADWKEIFKLSIADGSVRISGYKKNDTIVEIPETIDGHPVMKIGDGAFKDHGNIESILLPSSITEIGANAFRGCIKLESIVLPEAVESIGHSAFGECTSLQNIVLPQTIKYLGDKVFMGCAALKQVTLPEGLEWVLESLFDGCHSLETVRIPDTVKEILDYAFRDCKALQQVVMPAKLTTIGQGAFTNCKTLTELVLPDGVKEIDHYAFRGCTKLTKIRIPATAKSIRPDAFNGCKKLTIHAPVGCRGANLAKANKIPFVAE
jgi:hypothetical protein